MFFNILNIGFFRDFDKTESLAPFFGNISFLFLFFAMTFYWVDLAFQNKNPRQGIAHLKNFLSILLANVSLIILLCIRWKESGHFPLSNLYESLMFLSWSCTSIHLFLIFNYVGTPNLSLGPLKNQFIDNLLGSILAPCALFLNAFATFSLPKEMQEAGPLVPALQSNWLMMHVTVMIISYAALILGSLLSIVLVISSNIKKLFKDSKSSVLAFSGQAENLQNSQTKSPYNIENTSATLMPLQTQLAYTNSVGAPEGLQNKIFTNLDYLSYRIIGIGFPFLTIGILSGAVWANEAWGSYWSWDPKETWALLTWLVFAIYLHTRLTKGWEGEKPALIASFGFIVVWVCYLGVNLLGEGLHSYGFLT